MTKRMLKQEGKEIKLESTGQNTGNQPIPNVQQILLWKTSAMLHIFMFLTLSSMNQLEQP